MELRSARLGEYVLDGQLPVSEIVLKLLDLVGPLQVGLGLRLLQATQPVRRHSLTGAIARIAAKAPNKVPKHAGDKLENPYVPVAQPDRAAVS